MSWELDKCPFCRADLIGLSSNPPGKKYICGTWVYSGEVDRDWDCVDRQLATLHQIIRRMAEVIETGFYGTMENADRKVRVMNSPVVKGIIGDK